jgi:hypothetical protein
MASAYPTRDEARAWYKPILLRASEARKLAADPAISPAQMTRARRLKRQRLTRRSRVIEHLIIERTRELAAFQHEYAKITQQLEKLRP